MLVRSFLSIALGFALPACGGDEPAGPWTAPTRFTVHVAADAPFGVSEAAHDVVDLLGRMGVEAELSDMPGPRGCDEHAGHVVLAGDAIGDAAIEPALETDQTFFVDEERCSGGVLVTLAGGGLLGRQYAAYEWLHRIGVRFFHPEDTYVPDSPRWGDEPLALRHTPAFRWRSVSLHLTHPLELGDAFVLGEAEHFPEAQRYIDWTIHNGASRGIGGVGGDAGGELADRGIRRGFLRETGFNLHSTQQGGRPILDPDDPRTEEEQIAAAIDERLDVTPRPDVFGFTFNPSEFTEIPDTDAVRQISFITSYITEHYPGVRVETINHGTHGEPTPSYGVRFYDLSQFAPPELGVKVHTLMFYDLFRPAPVYGNTDFHFLYDFMAQEHTRRSIEYFPEAAWWLTFDIAVPLYLPITIEARDRDIQGIAWMLDGGLDGHHVFGTGHEWGYWQNEYCSFRMAMDTSYRWTDCLDDITSPMGAAGPDVRAVIEDVVAAQERDFVTSWQDTLPYLVGTDPETEVAASAGIVFHPLPPTPAAIMHWDTTELAAWEARHLSALQRMDDEYASFVARLRSLAATVPPSGAPWFAEILDGVEVTGLRAKHAWQAYGAVVAHREAELSGDAAREEAASALLASAKATTELALAVIARRESGYRYAPIERSTAGGPDGTEDDNWTVYHYRYLGRTHVAYYWTRIDRLAEEAIAGGGDAVFVSDALLGPGETLGVEVRDAELTEPGVDWGDGSPPETGATSFTHDYTARDVYGLRVSATRGVDPFELAGDVASLSEEHQTGFTGTVAEPMGVSLIEGLMPSVVFGRVDDARLALGFSAAESGRVELGRWLTLDPVAVSTALFESEPATFTVPIVNRSAETVQTEIVVENATAVWMDASSPLVISGDLSTDAVVHAVVAVGGFDEPGARAIVASTLGYTPDTLPATVAFRAEYAVAP